MIIVGPQVEDVLQLADDLVAVLARAGAVVLVRHGGPMIRLVSGVACMKGEVYAPDIAGLPVADAIELADVSLQLGKDGVDGSLRDGDDLGVGAVVGEFLQASVLGLSGNGSKRVIHTHPPVQWNPKILRHREATER